MNKCKLMKQINVILSGIPFDCSEMATLMDFADEHDLDGLSDDLDDKFILSDDGTVLLDRDGKKSCDASVADVRRVCEHDLGVETEE